EGLRAVDRILRVRHGLPLRDLTDEHLVLIVPRYDARRDARALLVDDHLGLAPFHDRNHTVRRPEVDPDNPTHGLCLRIPSVENARRTPRVEHVLPRA